MMALWLHVHEFMFIAVCLPPGPRKPHVSSCWCDQSFFCNEVVAKLIFAKDRDTSANQTTC